MDKTDITNPASHSLFDFGTVAQDYDRWYLTPEGRAYDRTQKMDVLTLLPRAQPGERLLDVGCGTGHWSKFFGSLGYDVVGVDISERMIEVAESHRPPNCIFQVADACRLPFQGHSFNIVTAMATLGFVSDVSQVLEEMFRCVQENGVVLVGVLNRLAHVNQKRLTANREPYVSGRLFSRKDLYDLLRQRGHVRMVGSVPKTTGYGKRFWRSMVHWMGLEDSRFEAPFIVAEVRR